MPADVNYSFQEQSRHDYTTNEVIKMLSGSNKIDLSKVNVKPKFVVKKKDNQLLYVYKLESGECWYEYSDPQPANDPEKRELLESSKSEKVSVLETKSAEFEFMAENIEFIVDPEMKIRAYLH